ncbi:lipoyl(octanoyl) transferase LipB [Desulfocicer niacini]
MTNNAHKPSLTPIMDLGLLDYQEALDLQQQYVEEKKSGIRKQDIILVLEHPAVFTLGRRGGRENLVVSEAFLKERGIPVVQTGRGGNITFHGPGQLVVYPIIDLNRAGMGVADFVHLLEEIMIKTAAHAGVTAHRSQMNHGIWVKNRKLGSIGLSVTRGICFHGLALNVNLDLTPFSWVNPCGLTGVSMTSLETETRKKDQGATVSMDRVKSHLLHSLTNAIG